MEYSIFVRPLRNKDSSQYCFSPQDNYVVRLSTLVEEIKSDSNIISAVCKRKINQCDVIDIETSFNSSDELRKAISPILEREERYLKFTIIKINNAILM